MSTVAPGTVDLQHLDFDVPCCRHTCEQTADWWLVCRSCNAHHPWCEPHRRQEVLDLAVCSPIDRVRCGNCLETVRIRQWARLFEFIPVGAA